MTKNDTESVTPIPAGAAPVDVDLGHYTVQPTIGRIVLLKGLVHNGSDEHPAIITRVWPPRRDPKTDAVLWHQVNLTVFIDAGTPYPETSVHLLPNRKAWNAFMTMKDNPSVMAAFWPDRV